MPGFRNQGSWDAILVKIQLRDGVVVAVHQWGAEGIDGYGNVTLGDVGHVYVSDAGSPVGGPSTGDPYHLVARLRCCPFS